MSTYVLREAETPNGLRRIAYGIATPGPQGPPGTAGGGHEHVQSVLSDEWIVNHNLGYQPAVVVRNAGGQQVWAQVVHMSVNQYRVYPSPAMTGTARGV